MQEHVYKTPVRDTSDLKQRLIDIWASIPQSVVDAAIDQWRIRRIPTNCVHAGRQEVVTSDICYNQPVLFRATHILP